MFIKLNQGQSYSNNGKLFKQFEVIEVSDKDGLELINIGVGNKISSDMKQVIDRELIPVNNDNSDDDKIFKCLIKDGMKISGFDTRIINLPLKEAKVYKEVGVIEILEPLILDEVKIENILPKEEKIKIKNSNNRGK